MEIPLLLLAGLLGLTLMATVSGSLFFTERHRVDLESAWRDFARVRRFELTGGEGTWPHWRSPRVDGRRRDVTFVVDTCIRSRKGNPRGCTRVRGSAMESYQGVLEVSSNDAITKKPVFWSRGGKKLGDPFFDDAFSVRASSSDVVAHVLADALRRDLQRFASATPGDGVLFEFHDGDIELLWVGEEARGDVLDQAIDTVVDACRAQLAMPSYR